MYSPIRGLLLYAVTHEPFFMRWERRGGGDGVPANAYQINTFFNNSPIHRLLWQVYDFSCVGNRMSIQCFGAVSIFLIGSIDSKYHSFIKRQRFCDFTHGRLIPRHNKSSLSAQGHILLERHCKNIKVRLT